MSEKPNQRLLTIISQDSGSMVVDVTRSEGEVSKEGDAFNAENMNDLEERMESALNEKLDGQKLEYDTAVILAKTSADGSAPDCYAIKLLFDQLKKYVADGKKLLADAISAQGIETASADMTFQELADLITSTGSGRYSSGYNAGYAKGKEDGSAAGSQSGYATGYAAGKNDGIAYADGRVNGNSESYKAGYNAGVPAGKNAAYAQVSTSCSWGSDNPGDNGVRAATSGSASATATLQNGRLTIALSGQGSGTGWRWLDDGWKDQISASSSGSRSNAANVS